MAEDASLARYLREAFLYRWNLLLLGSGIGFSVLSGHSDILLPLMGALELGYLVALLGQDRFRSAINAKVHQEQGGLSDEAPATKLTQLDELLAHLEKARVVRFEALRERCMQMRFLAEGARGGTPQSRDAGSTGLDRLLWVFLRLLVSQEALAKFLGATDRTQIVEQLKSFRARLEGSSELEERLRRALVDSVATAELRLENYEKAESNAEFVGVELDRLEGKIHALVETAVGHEDPDYISSQVDSVAHSMAQTEKAMRELDAITGLSADDAPPPILTEREVELS